MGEISDLKLDSPDTLRPYERTFFGENKIRVDCYPVKRS